MSGTVSFVPAAADAVAVSRGSSVLGLKRRRFHVRLAILVIVGVAAGIFFDWLADQPVTLRDALTGGLAALAWMGVLVVLLYLLLPRRSRRHFRQQRSLDQPFTFRWNSDGIVFSSASSHSELAWTQYHDWFETRAVFAFGLSEQLYHWVPKRVMDDVEIEDLRDTAARHMPA